MTTTRLPWHTCLCSPACSAQVAAIGRAIYFIFDDGVGEKPFTLYHDHCREQPLGKYATLEAAQESAQQLFELLAPHREPADNKILAACFDQ